jgi:NAD(P)-dependent dehydrogenase (short-subunit alcohol dehydrogenase family)
MTGTLGNSTVLVVGGTHRLGAAIAAAAEAQGAHVIVSAHAPCDETTLRIDLSTAGMSYSAPIREMELSRVQEAIAAKMTGPLLLAKHFQIRRPLTLFSGQVAWCPASGSYATGITNGAVAFAAQHLAAELAPIRVNAISPGIIDSGLWDARGAEKAAFLTAAASRTLVGSTGTVRDIVDAVLWIMSAPFFTGETLRLDGGRR